MRRKTWCAALAALAILLLCVTGCGSQAEDGRTHITYAIWDKNQQPAMEAIAARFEEQHPDIKVDVQLIPWNQYWTKLEASAMSDTMPDVFWMHTQSFLRYASNGMLMDVTWLAGYDPAMFPADLVAFYTYEGKRYAIPKDYDTIGLWYNKTLFDAKGIPYPDETWDWDKLVKVAQELTDTEHGVYGFLAPLDQQSLYYDFVYQNGGEILNADKTRCGYRDAATQEAIQFAIDLSQRYHVSPTIQQFADMSREQYFQSGKAAMGFFGSWMLGDFAKNEYVAQNCDVAMLPKGKQRATIYGGLGNAVAAKTKHKEAALAFASYLASKEANEIQGRMNACIPAYRGTEQGWVQANAQFHVKVYPEALAYAVIFPNSETREKWMLTETDVLKNAWSGERSVKDACDELATKIDAMLETEGK
ncbi:sugar ABC transporter substrate-binding protein [Selenomonas sp.]|uniref:ABC transporter substrate-binding protein n=1 Tax=Selenomonas sp. TaxID=2053611 RepID=UPI0025CD0DD1|nr:sugar ABC transporter substrate-binding protein [Selenomonas sp.]MCI6283691.1 sugar ABC transporter substrate-binding protein [Selenomonas sp.]